jgi:hypothetical protein
MGNLAKTRTRWKKSHPPDEEGNYTCAICLKPLPVNQLSLDHILRIEDFPQFKHQLWNLQPTHCRCNTKRDQILVQGKNIKAIQEPHTHLSTEHVELVKRVLAQAHEYYKKYEWLNADVKIIEIKETMYERIS